MKELSIFVDESGDSGDYSEHSSYYIISLITHNLRNDIDSDIGNWNSVHMHDGASFFSYSNSVDDDMTAIRHRYISSAGQGNAAIHRP